MGKIKVSVIIPVYNAEKFLPNAVESAVVLDEVEEVILVEDNSLDSSLEVCANLERKYSKVNLFRHPNGENRGAGASRNLGIEKSSCEFVAFLDADDWYLPSRFEAENQLFQQREVDGVFGATGYYVQGKGFIEGELTRVKRLDTPSDLLFRLINMDGRFHANAITIRKSIFSKVGLFKEELRLHQDTHMWYRLAHFGNVLPGNNEKAVAIRRVHPGNRITKKNAYSRKLLHQAVYEDFIRYSNVDERAMRIIINRFIHVTSSNGLKKILNYFSFFCKYPRALKFYI